MRRALVLTFQGLLVLLFALAFWFRVTSLEAMPDPDGDEVWYGVQAYHIAHGEPFEFQTPTGNPLNPLQTVIEVALLKVFRPEFWIFRAPSVLWGIVAVVLTYVLGARIFDKMTATIASALLAVLPIALIYSRKGYDCAPTPLVTLVLLYFTFKAEWKGMLLAFLACLITHPTNLFLAPIVLPIYLVQQYRKNAGDPVRQRRLIVGTLAALAVAVVAGVAILSRPSAYRVYSVNLQVGKLGWPVLLEFLTRYGRMLVGTGSFGVYPGRLADWCFWSIFLTAVIVGTGRFVRAGQWDRVALLVGLVAGATGLYVVTAAEALRADANRYGLFLVMPSVLLFACAARSLLIAPTTPSRAVVLKAQYAALLVLGWALLLMFKVDCFDAYRNGSDKESIWTAKTDEKDPKKRAFRMILKDIDGRKAAGGAAPPREVIVAQNWWLNLPLTYLALPRKDIDVLDYMCLPDQWERLRQLLEGGAYVVGYPGQEIEKNLYATFPADRIRRMDAVRYGNTPPACVEPWASSLVVFRLKPASAAPPAPPAPLTASGPHPDASGASATR